MLLWSRVRAQGVIPVLTVDQLDAGVPLARALVDGGMDVLELTLRTPIALELVREIKASVPNATVGVGTILTATQVEQAADAGAAFGVAPGLNPAVVRAAQARDLPFIPGVATPSEVEWAVDLQCRVLKFFPAEAIGGLTYLKSMAAPYDHLDLQYVPLGGIHAGNVGSYLAERCVLAVGGSWIASRPLIQARDWAAITANAREARAIAAQAQR